MSYMYTFSIVFLVLASVMGIMLSDIKGLRKDIDKLSDEIDSHVQMNNQDIDLKI